MNDNRLSRLRTDGLKRQAKTKVLIVEDDTPLVLFMVSILTHVGCDVETARTGKRAIELAAEKRFDIITLDIGLPDTTGFNVCCELKQRHISRRTPIIFISASPCQQDIDEGMKRGAVDYITKPFDTTDFVYRVIYYAKAIYDVSERQPTETV